MATRERRTTLQEVGRAAGVSPMTVSNFVNGRYRAMSALTRGRIEAVIQELGYRPDGAARSLRTARQMSVGIIIVDESPHFLSDGVTTQVVSGLGNALNAAGYTLQIEGLRARDFEKARLLRTTTTDGLCLLLSGSTEMRAGMLMRARETALPIVGLLEPFAGEGDYCCLYQDDRAGGRLLAEHLLSRGARRLVVAEISHNKWRAIGERIEGIREFALAAGAEVDLLPCGDGTMDSVAAATQRYLAENPLPDAFLGLNDQIGIAIIKTLKARGLGVPGDCRVTGFNAFDVWRYSEPQLTTVRSPGYEIGRAAGEAMLTRLRSGAFATRETVLPVAFLAGESS